jgi:hypothetical protein
LQGRRTWLQHLCVTLACTRCSSASFSASCDAIRIGLPLPRAECFCSILADALVQFSPDLRLRLAVPHSPLLPPREPKPAHIGAISISFASSPQCCLISFAAFPLTVSDILHARLYCSLGGSACSRHITTPLASRATSLHIVTLHAVQLLLRFQLPNPCSPGLAASLPRSHTRVRATWAYSCPGRATRARANRASSALRARSTQHLHTPLASAALPRACSRHPLGVAHIRSCTASRAAHEFVSHPHAASLLGTRASAPGPSRIHFLRDMRLHSPAHTRLLPCTSTPPAHAPRSCCRARPSHITCSCSRLVCS